MTTRHKAVILAGAGLALIATVYRLGAPPAYVPPPLPEPVGPVERFSGGEVIPGEFIVTGPRGATNLARLGVRSVKALDTENSVYLVHTDPDVGTSMLQAEGAWGSVEPNRRWHISEGAASWNDPLRPSQYFHDKLRTDDAYAQVPSASGVRIGILDTGVWRGHPDLEPIVAERSSAFPPNFGGTDSDPNGHGTHVAGLAAAIAGNGIGGLGIGQGATLYVYQFLDASGSGDTAGAISGYAWLRSKGVDVINNSWGGGELSAALRLQMQVFMQAGGVSVCAAGNDQSNVDNWPAADPNCLSVAATGQDDRKAVFTNFAPSVDVSAPGVALWSTCAPFDGDYCRMSGTSMASPVVAGAVAILKRARPDIRFGEALDVLRRTGDLSPSAELANMPRVNLARAVAAIMVTGPLPSPLPSFTPLPPTLTPTETPFPPGYPSPEPVRTNTPSASWTPSATRTPRVITSTPRPTDTPTAPPTLTPTSTSTLAPTVTRTATRAVSPTPTFRTPTPVPATVVATKAPPLKLPLPAGCYTVTDVLGRQARVRIMRWAGWLYQMEYCP